jgi:hypothetical protein
MHSAGFPVLRLLFIIALLSFAFIWLGLAGAAVEQPNGGVIGLFLSVNFFKLVLMDIPNELVNGATKGHAPSLIVLLVHTGYHGYHRCCCWAAKAGSAWSQICLAVQRYFVPL